MKDLKARGGLTMVKGGLQTDESHQSWTEWLEEKIRVITIFVKAFGIAASAVGIAFAVSFLIWQLVNDGRKRAIVIEPLTLPKVLEDRGYSSSLETHKMRRKIELIQGAIGNIPSIKPGELRDRAELAAGIEFGNFRIPGTGMSLDSASHFLEDFLHLAPQHVSARLVSESGVEWHQRDDSDPRHLERFG